MIEGPNWLCIVIELSLVLFKKVFGHVLLLPFGSQLLSDIQTFLAGNQLYELMSHRRGCGGCPKKLLISFRVTLFKNLKWKFWSTGTPAPTSYRLLILPPIPPSSSSYDPLFLLPPPTVAASFYCQLLLFRPHPSAPSSSYREDVNE